MSHVSFDYERNGLVMTASGSSLGTSPILSAPMIRIDAVSGGAGVALPLNSSVPSGYCIFVQNSSGENVFIYCQLLDLVNNALSVLLPKQSGALISCATGSKYWFASGSAEVV